MSDIHSLLTEIAEFNSLLYVERAAREILSPEWEKTSLVHDWRNYISDEGRHSWPHLSIPARVCLYYSALCQAAEEEWD